MLRLLLALVACWLSGQVLAQDVKTFIPKAAYEWLPVIKTESDQVFPTTPSLGYFGGLAEQESCISLTHSKCWNTHSMLKTSREQGVGLFQITRTFRSNGSTRFDTLDDLHRKYKAQLNELSWTNVAERGDLQIRAMMLMTRDNYTALNSVTDPIERLKMADSAYNQGLGGLYADRRLCSLTKGCNAQLWFKNVERTPAKAGAVIYGRKVEQINREHVSNIFLLRMPKYDAYYAKQGLKPRGSLSQGK